VKTIVCFVILAAAALALAQAPDTLWTREYGGPDHDNFRAVQMTSDGGYIAAGSTRSFGAGDYDFYLVKTNADGDTQWTRTYGGGTVDQAYAVQQTSDGGYVVAGGTKSFGTYLASFPDLTPQFDVWVVRTNSTGGMIWAQNYGGTLHDEARAVQQTQDGGFIIVGYTQSYGLGDKNVYVIKTNANGDTIWTRTYGGSNSEEGYAVVQTADLGYAIAGYTKSYGAGNSDFYLIKTNAGGVPSWAHTYGGAANDEAYAMKIDYDGGFVLAGYTASFGAGASDFYLVKTDASGIALWTQTYGSIGEEKAYAIDLLPFECGYVLVGYSYNSIITRFGEEDLYIVRTECDGEECWNSTYGGSSGDIGYGVDAAADRTYIIAGVKFSGPGPSKAWLVKIGTDDSACDCDPITAIEFDLGDLSACNYPTLIGNPAHGITGVAWLGATITSEGSPNSTDLDGGDDGVQYHDLPWMPCEDVSVTVTVTAGPGYEHYTVDCDNSLFLNGWKDGNLDGDFCDTLCVGPGQPGVPEWIVQDEVVTAGPHTFFFLDPGVLTMGVYNGVFRWRLTSVPVGVRGFGATDLFACPNMCSGLAGSGGDWLGEVEDYIIENGQLAVELTSFTATPGDGNVTLQWSTASETDNDHFTLYRRIQGTNFAQLTQVPGSGTSSLPHDYEYVDRNVINGVTYLYQLADVDINGVQTIHDIIVSATPSLAGSLPSDYALHQNYPNPFNASTQIRFDLKDAGRVTLTVYNLLGQEVAILVDENLDAGPHSVTWDASELPTGIYLYQLQAGDYRAVRKLLYLK